MMFRGRMSTKEVDEQMLNVVNKNTRYVIASFTSLVACVGFEWLVIYMGRRPDR